MNGHKIFEWLDIQMQPKADFYINICEAKRLASKAIEATDIG